MRTVLRQFAFCAVAAALVWSNPAARADISTVDDWNGVAGFGYLGNNSFQSFGETFVATEENSSLSSITFYLQLSSGAPQQCRALVYEWDETGSALTGPALFTSPVFLGPDAAVMTAVTIDTGAVQLQPGKTYAVIFSVAGLVNPAGDYGLGGIVNTVPYPEGHLVASFDGITWTNNGLNLAFNFVLGPRTAPETPGQFYLFSPVAPVVAPGTATLTIRRTGSLGAVTVAYATVDGTALAGRDYTATSGVLSFAAGQTDQTISIPLLAGALTGLQFSVQLSNPTGGATISAPGAVTLTISGVSPAPSPYIAAAAEAYAAAAAYFAQGDQANGYFCYAYYQYYLYLLDPSSVGHLNAYYENLANAYYLSYTAAGDPVAALAWYNYYISFES